MLEVELREYGLVELAEKREYLIAELDLVYMELQEYVPFVEKQEDFVLVLVAYTWQLEEYSLRVLGYAGQEEFSLLAVEVVEYVEKYFVGEFANFVFERMMFANFKKKYFEMLRLMVEEYFEESEQIKTLLNLKNQTQNLTVLPHFILQVACFQKNRECQNP